MKILYFNWVPTRALSVDGGGVSVYQKNLLLELSTYTNVDVYYLTTSYAYNIFSSKIYIRKVKQTNIKNIKEFEIVNAPILAPSFFSFDKIEEYFKFDKSIDVILNFLKKEKFDIIHFNNLEGISAQVLSLKKFFPRTKFIISLHNYFPFCAQVNLWYRDYENCIDYLDGKKCKNCNIFPVDYNMKKFERSNLANLKHRNLSKFLGKIYSCFCKDDKKDFLTEDYKFRRMNYVKLINENVDIVVAVSKRVKKIAIDMGIDSNKCIVKYIGTKHAEYVNEYKNITNHNGDITLGYLGYMRRDKGFYFFLDALENMPENISKFIGIVCAAPITDKDAYNRLKFLNNKFKFVKIYDGYKQENLKFILSEVSLGVVPVLWEDNLPQVALEFVAYGIPIITSNLGGAQELTGSEHFIFEAGDFMDFFNKIKYIIDNKESLGLFWININEKNILNTISNHCKELLELYK